jgi:hypothetical protein
VVDSVVVAEVEAEVLAEVEAEVEAEVLAEVEAEVLAEVEAEVLLSEVELLELEAVVVFSSVLSLQPTKARTAKSIATTIMRDKNFFMIKVLLL